MYWSCWFWSTAGAPGCDHYDRNTTKLTGSSAHVGGAWEWGPHSGDWAETGESSISGSVSLFSLLSFPERNSIMSCLGVAGWEQAQLSAEEGG